MSRHASGDKLRRMTFTQGQNDVELLVRFAPASDPPTGSVRDQTGVEQPFTGWLGLLRLLEDHGPIPRVSALTEPQGELMSTNTATTVAPIAHGPEEGQALWFLGTLVTIKSSAETTDGCVGVTENLAPRGSGSPLHVHRNEDEWFGVIEGELTFWVGGQVITAPAGSFVYGPRNVPHTFTVASDQARFLLVVEPAGFESFIRELGEPAQELVIPPAAMEPPDIARLTALAADHGVEILGPPGIPA
jgi:quercetin dioxygenase-like cupin family protein